MAINFPDSPTIGDSHTVGDKSWTWDGTTWNLIVASSTDHGSMGGLGDDDHTQYLHTNGSRSADTLTVTGDLTVDTSTLHVDSTNNRVGIGTSIPYQKLQIIQDGGNLSAGSVSDETKGTIHLENFGGTKGDGELSTGISFSGTSTGRRRALISAYQDGVDGDPHGLQFFTYGSTTTSSDAVTSRMTIDSSGNVGIGTSSPSSLLELSAPSSVLSITDSDGTLGGSMSAMVYYKDSAGNIQGQIGYGTGTGYMIVDNNDGPMRVGTASADSLYLRTNNANQITIDSAGNVTFAGNLTVSGDQITMAATSSRDKYRVWNSTYYTIGMEGNNFGALGDYAMTFQMNSDNNRGWWWGDTAHTTSQGAMSLTTIGQLTIANSIRVGFGESDTTAPGISNGVQANGGFYSNSSYVSRPGASATGFYLNPQLPNTGGGRALDIRACSDSSSAPFQFLTGNSFAFVTDGTTRLTIDNGGITKSGGTFDIQHPLDADDSTSRLRHGFVESPYNDNMYRGTTTLGEDGQAVVDLDSHYGMRDGTWTALNTNPWVIASVNGGSSVAWALTGKTLTLTGTAGESVQWLVIGERHDPHVMSEKNPHTDENGRLILEYTREWEDEDGWTPPHLLGESVEY